MAGRIPKAFIDDLLARVDVVDVIDARVPLKKAGANHVACCPFHNEKTPSFTVSQSKQFYHCFGCGAHGTAIGFLMEYDRLSFPEAIETLAHSLGLEVPHEGGQQEPRRDYSELYNVLQKAASFYQQQLKSSPAAIDYLKKRGLSGQTAYNFNIGFAPAGWDNLIKALNAESNPELQKHLKIAGLANERESGGVYDRFRNRIVFPIHDRRGRVCGFGGRVIDPKEEPKYLNSPETPVFQKGNELYGLFHSRQHNSRLDFLLVVEGYMDVVMLSEHGISNAVATLGTATTTDNLRNLFKASNEIVFCFDGDAAGQKAAWRAFETSLPELLDRHQIKFLFLPDSEDPDSLVQKEGKEKFLERIHDADTLSEYFLKQLHQRFDASSLDGRAQMADFAQPLIQKINAKILKELLSESLAKQVGLSSNKLLGTTPVKASAPPTTKPRMPRQIKLEMNDTRLAVAALLSKPELAIETNEVDLLAQLRKPGISLLVEIIQLIKSEPDFNTAQLLERYRERDESHALNKLAVHTFPNPDNDPNLLNKAYHDAIQQLTLKAREQRYEDLLNKPANELSESERQEIQNFGKDP